MLKKIHNKTKFFINGIPAIDIARQHNISKSCIYDRLVKGWDITKACTYKKMPIKQLADKLGVKISKVRMMMKNGTSHEELEAMVNGK